MANGIINKSVSFNTLDPDEKKYFLHAMNRTNFSRYVKSLIQRDYDGVYAPGPSQAQEKASDDPVNKEIAEGFI